MAKHQYQPKAASVDDSDPVAVLEQPIAVAVEAPVVVAELPKFRVSIGDKSDIISAPNAADAWAMYCDKNKSWPNPNKCGRVVEQVK